jgi:hypothetical protein
MDNHPQKFTQITFVSVSSWWGGWTLAGREEGTIIVKPPALPGREEGWRPLQESCPLPHLGVKGD